MYTLLDTNKCHVYSIKIESISHTLSSHELYGKFMFKLSGGSTLFKKTFKMKYRVLVSILKY